mgnify:CR=1 FL=1
MADELALQQTHHGLEAALLELAIAADIEHLRVDVLMVEEDLSLHVLEHARVRLGQHGHVQRPRFPPRERVGDLVGQRGLADAGRAFEDVDAALEQAAVEDGVESFDVGAQSFHSCHYIGLKGEAQARRLRRKGQRGIVQPFPRGFACGGPRSQALQEAHWRRPALGHGDRRSRMDIV